MLRSILVFILAAAAICAPADTLRIGLVARFKDVCSVTIKSASGLTIHPSDGTPDIDANGPVVVDKTPSGARVTADTETTTFASGVTIQTKEGAPISVSSSSKGTAPSYRGSIAISTGKNGLQLVNNVELEDYLRGVLPCEMPTEFNVEALKAQAVAARTYAWSNRNKHRKDGYDLCDCTHCQLYGGVSKEARRSDQAIKDTDGVVAVYQGRLISALYSSDCGGVTESGDQPYLVSVTDHTLDCPSDACEWSGHSWKQSWPLTELETLLRKALPDLKGLTGLTVTSVDQCNRVDEIKLEAEAGSTTLSGIKIRSTLGATVVKSTVFTVTVADGKVTFEGKGFGHGIGLCQFGANGLAKSPSSYSFEQILKHYYTGIDLVPLSTLTVAHAD